MPSVQHTENKEKSKLFQVLSSISVISYNYKGQQAERIKYW